MADNMSSPISSSRKRKQSIPSNSKFIWAKDGNTLHPAYLLSSPSVGASVTVTTNNNCNGIDFGIDGGNNSDIRDGKRDESDDEESIEYVWVQWTSNGTTSRIPKANISSELPSRRSSRRSASSSMKSSSTAASRGAEDDSSNSGSRDMSIDKDEDEEYVDNKPKITTATKSKRKSRLSLTKKQRLQFKEHHTKQHKVKNYKRSIDIKPNEILQGSGGMKQSSSSDCNSKSTSSSKSTTTKKVHHPKQQQNTKEDDDMKLAIQMSLQSYNNNNNTISSSSAMGTDESSSSSKKQKFIHNEIIDIIDSDNDMEEKKDDNDVIGMSSTNSNESSSKQRGGGLKRSARVSLSPDLKSKQSKELETNPSIRKSQPDQQYEQINSQHKQQKSKQASIPTTTAQSTSNDPPQYTHRSSAYIQHIAEATTIIMTDARWFTNETITTLLEEETISDEGVVPTRHQQRSLFMWEKGDDLSAVKAFMSLYDDEKTIIQTTEGKSENKKPAVEVSAEEEPAVEAEEDDKMPAEEKDEVFESAMHLYSRMFTRKGPYFDIADLYTRYYAPKPSTNQVEEPEEVSPGESQDSSGVDEANAINKASSKVKGFFAPRLSVGKSNSSNNNPNPNLLPHQIAMKHLFQDILRLLSMGLIRTFESEYECGYVAGNVNIGGSRRGTLLSSNERRDILNKLGGGGKSTKVPARTSLGKSNSSTNEILNQMQNQQTLLSSFAKSSKASVGGKANKPPMLPVIKHVDKLLMNKLSVKVASLVSNTQPRKAEVEEATRMIQKAWSAAYTVYKDDDRTCMTKLSSNSITTTFRLREAPLKTLRRCLRLFLCAGGGPGAMRGDGSNGWISVLDGGISNDPCSLTSKWHTVTYPGLSSRFGLEYYELSRHYTAIMQEAETTSTIGPFSRYCEFQLWEIGVELRSFVDQVNEMYEIQKQTLRRRERELSKSESQESSRSEEVVHSFNDGGHTPIYLLNRNGFTLLTEDGRTDLVKSLMTLCFIEGQLSRYTTFGGAVASLCQQIEVDTLSLSNTTIDDDDDEDDNDGFISDTERVIAATAIICHRILQLRIQHPSLMLTSLSTRPWLRHMNFDAILTYILWDVIPIFERRGHHLMVVLMLQTILFGEEVCSFDQITGELLPESCTKFESLQVKPFVECLLPRRNRGKAYERLVIDITHAERRAKKKASNQQPKKKKAKKSSKVKNDDEEEDIPSPHQSLCTSLLRSTEVSGSIPFFSMRNLARRSKQALPQTNERSLLNIRPGDNDNNWAPTTDNAVANSISSSDNSSDSAAGKRCSFVGWEMDDDVGFGSRRSLNVEELAMEQYHHGLLPDEDNMIKGQWVGWHNEGGHVRALFRILCLPHLLEASTDKDELYQDEQSTIIMTPYQFSPHDLHVGWFKANSQTVRGFYERRRLAIESFLSQLVKLDENGISNLIYTSIKKRWDRHTDDHSRSKDPRLIKDVKELITLSMIACALGGTALASIFRTLCFDYRSWSGGLPDLFLVRAKDSPDSESSSSFISLADWIGEGFSQEAIDEKNTQSLISLLAERDDEFLGQTKNADGFSSQQFTSKKKKKGIARVEVPPFPEDKLEFIHGEKQVKAECMFVEVKSANDRLSERQEDWLSILEGCTNARVCKFSSSK